MKPELTPEESLGIVSKAILTARIKNKETGSIFIFWGLIMMLSSLGQYILLQTKLQEFNYLPYYSFPLGAILTWLFYSKKFKIRDQNQVLASSIPLIWLVIGLNFMVLSIGYNLFLGQLLTPVVLLFLGIGTLLTGHIMKSRIILIGGLLCNLIAFICFQIDWEYHGLVLCGASLVCFVLPGFYIKLISRKQHA